MDDIAIIGIGNPLRGDDGAGWAVIDILEKKMQGGVALNRIQGDIAEIMDLFAKYSTVYCIDACTMDREPGFWQRIDAHLSPLPPDNSQTSTHGLSLGQAIDMAQALEQLPSKLIIYAINSDHYLVGAALTPKVAHAVESVAKKILEEEDIQACMKRV